MCQWSVMKEKIPALYKKQWALCVLPLLHTNVLISLCIVTLIFKVSQVSEQAPRVPISDNLKMKITPTLQKVYHITAFSWYAYIVKSLADRGGQELPPGIFVYGGPWKYLTFLNLVSTRLIERYSLNPCIYSRYEGLLNVSVIANVFLRTGGSE